MITCKICGIRNAESEKHPYCDWCDPDIVLLGIVERRKDRWDIRKLAKMLGYKNWLDLINKSKPVYNFGKLAGYVLKLEKPILLPECTFVAYNYNAKKDDFIVTYHKTEDEAIENLTTRNMEERIKLVCVLDDDNEKFRVIGYFDEKFFVFEHNSKYVSIGCDINNELDQEEQEFIKNFICDTFHHDIEHHFQKAL